jgi:hypothetical protein
MKVSVRKRSTGYEGVVQLPNFAPTTLEKKDGTTVYENTTTLRRAAELVAMKYNCTLFFNDSTTKVAAKKTAK